MRVVVWCINHKNMFRFKFRQISGYREVFKDIAQFFRFTHLIEGSREIEN